MSKRKGKRQPQHFMLSFRPKEYTGNMAAQVAHLSEDEKPLCRFKINKPSRGYYLVKKYRPLWARIYDRRDPSVTIDEYSHQRGWASGKS